MLTRKKMNLLLVIALAVVSLTGCGKGNFTLDPKKPNQSSSASRVTTSMNTGSSGQYGASQALTYYAGVTSAGVLQNVSVARSSTDPKKLRITAPSVGTGTSICVITGAVYTQCAYGTLFTDLGEERCNAINNGVGEFTMIRSDFNVVTIVLYNHLQQFSAWYNGTVAEAEYPSLARGQIDADYTTCQ